MDMFVWTPASVKFRCNVISTCNLLTKLLFLSEQHCWIGMELVLDTNPTKENSFFDIDGSKRLRLPIQENVLKDPCNSIKT